jgi:hypothetical protein
MYPMPTSPEERQAREKQRSLGHSGGESSGRHTRLLPTPERQAMFRDRAERHIVSAGAHGAQEGAVGLVMGYLRAPAPKERL